MEGVSVQIEPCKTYFSDGCVETVAADETDLLKGEPKIQSDESVSITFSTDYWPYNIYMLFYVFRVIGHRGFLNDQQHLVLVH